MDKKIGFEELKRDFLNRTKQGDKNPLAVIVIAIIFAIIGFYINNNEQNFIKNAETTTATLYYQRDTFKTSTDEYNYNVYAKYFINGKEYYTHLKDVTSKNSELFTSRDGEQKNIYYDPTNPDKISDGSSIRIGIFFIIFGIAIALIATIVTILRKVNKEGMDEVDDKITEKVVDFAENLNSKTELWNKVGKFVNIRNNIRRVIGIVVCVLVIMIGIGINMGDRSFSKNAQEITAIVSRIEQKEKRDADNRRYIGQDIYVKYIVNGRQYEKPIEMSSENIKPGSQVNIYYNPDNPEEIKSTNKRQYIGYIFIVIGVVTILGVLFI